uniref:OCEL domain-containing protein n=1 Tax=Caenorhabditis japonica TaxID=281687 RepID=A0A8R1HNZ5_CAEJA
MLKSSTHFSSASSNGHHHHVQSPHDLLTGNAVTNAPIASSPPVPVNLDVQKIDCTQGQTVVMVKLTDEMFAALEESQRSGKKLRIHVDEKDGRVEIGDGTASSKSNNTFYFQKQSIPEQTDTLVQTGGVVRNVGTYKTRYQIQATDRSFEETKKRAEKRAVDEKNRGTKEMKKGITGSSRFNPSSSSSSSSSHASRNASLNGTSRASPGFMSAKASTSQLPHSKGTPNGSDSRKIDMKSELMKKPLKKRVIHLVVTQKYKNWDEVYKKLQSDGLVGEKDEIEKTRCYVDEVSEAKPGMSVLCLKSNLLSEVDARWPFFNQDEKAHVRRLQAGPSGTRAVPAEAANNFAPMRKKGMERMTASSKSSSSEKKEKVEKVEEKIPSPVKEEKRVVEEEDDYYTAPEPRRRAHNAPPPPTTPAVPAAPIPQTASSQTDGPSPPKRTKRNESASPPEDPPQQTFEVAKLNPTKMSSIVAMQPMPKFEPPREHNAHHVSVVAANGGGSTASSRISSPASSLSSPSQPSCNWEKQFGDIKTLNEAEQYFKMFHKEYPIYMECHRKLTEVSAEFRLLEIRLQQAAAQRKLSPSPVTIQEVKKIEKQIQSRFADFEKDPEFMRARQRHTDLRSKLNVLKTRIGNWESHRRQATPV